MKKINYGIDAPKVIRNLMIIGILFLGRFLLFLAGYLRLALSITGVYFAAPALLMIAYAKFGKYKHRDRILNLQKLER